MKYFKKYIPAYVHTYNAFGVSCYPQIPFPPLPHRTINTQAFHKRITFCLDVHNEAVRAMRYPPNAYKKELDAARPNLEDEKTDEELAKEIEDEMNEDGGI